MYGSKNSPCSSFFTILFSLVAHVSGISKPGCEVSLFSCFIAIVNPMRIYAHVYCVLFGESVRVRFVVFNRFLGISSIFFLFLKSI